ncbi:FAD-binding oxidoreductase [Streptomyces sp. URMC 126]|uniref:FAD-binding oxidoreductase n=1 Tax=Streptomyces sp. URMC 126 TaxID=3423401 RepID=UPI003F1C4C33
MVEVTRRDVLARTAVLGGAAAALTVPASASPAVAAPPSTPGPVTVGPGDPRYRSLTHRGRNARFSGSPDLVVVAASAEQVTAAVQQAVDQGRRLAVRSGGHCFEDFVDGPDVRLLIDLSPMTAVAYDARRRAFAVEPGGSLGSVYKSLFLGWGVALPAGATAEVGVGGHILGGGYGALSRRHGLAVDHLYGVEVVVVDARGKARRVVATREPDDPNRELWWAHTGGGGGNFGVVTRYWFRSPDAGGSDPSRLLPRAPEAVTGFTVSWPWKGLDRRSFTRLVRNHGEWHERNSAPGTRSAGLFSVLMLNTRRSEAAAYLSGQVDSTGPDARRLVDAYVAALGRGVGVEPVVTREELPWLQAAAAVQESAPAAFKVKAGYLRRRFTDRQIDVLHDRLAAESAGGLDGTVWLVSYGGRVNAVAPEATAVAQRDSVLKALFVTGWKAPREDAAPRLRWVRDLYRAVYADSGGVPAPGDVSDGSFVNYPDTDLADPALNTSGTPWHALYYKRHYPRLQRVKARWDPREVFRHALSVRPPR